jgi:2-haloacid dehalogenase
LVDAWRGAYMPSMDEVRKHPDRGFVILDELQRKSVEPLAAKLGITGLTSADFDYLTRGWHSLEPWPDSVGGLTRLKKNFIISPLSNGNVALLVNMAKHAGLPWDLVLSAEIFKHYKPDPETYLGAAKILSLRPDQVMLVAAHNNDLAAAQAVGLKTAFVPRPTEYGPLQNRDFGPEGEWDFVVSDLNDLADKFGC